MKIFKFLPLAAAVSTALITVPVFAEDTGIELSGYARYGFQFENDENTNVVAKGQTGNAVGRLGNEGNGGEFKLSKAFERDNGTKFDLGIMLENWGRSTLNDSGDALYSNVYLKQFYAGATNVFPSQPDSYLWAGRVFHSRVQQTLNDYYIAISDGQGAGIKNVDLGFAKMEFGVVGATDGNNYSGNADNGDYAITSKLSDIKLTDTIKLDLVANYGFSTEASDPENTQAYLLMAKFIAGNHNFYARYTDNLSGDLNNVLNKKEDNSSIFASIEGKFNLNESVAVDYLVGYHDVDGEGTINSYEPYKEDRTNINMIVRPTYTWNNIHSTWLEAGYSTVDYEDGGDTEAWKLTLSQNVAVGGNLWDRPMLRFYATMGEEKDVDGSVESPFIVGAMFEAWW